MVGSPLDHHHGDPQDKTPIEPSVTRVRSSDRPVMTSRKQELPDLSGMTIEELEALMLERGKDRYRAAQVMKWIHQGLKDSFDDMTNLSKGLRGELTETCRIGFPQVLEVALSEDGTKKYLLGLADGQAIEAVLIPAEDHDTLCVSTQVGCAMGCLMCRTAKMGLRRNLTAGEIATQLLAIRRHEKDSKITNVVFMGMGEPLANYANTVKAAGIMTHPNGPQISWRRLTVSTCGLIPEIRKLGHEVRVKLAVSLNAVTDEQRDVIMPINRKYPIGELLAALREYPIPRRYRITFEYVLIRDFNDSEADARRLIRLLNPIRSKVNLIPLNEGAMEGMEAPPTDRIERFQQILLSRSLMAMVRRSRGRDIRAACGELAARRIEGK